MSYLAAASVTQVGQSEPGESSATLLVSWTLGTQLPDVVEVYAKSTSQAGQAPRVASVEIGFQSENESSITVRAPDEIEVTICPRMNGSDGLPAKQQPDESGNDQHFQNFCVTSRITTKADAPGPSKPKLAIVARHPKTRTGENRITMTWASSSYNDGDIHWGTLGQNPEFHHSIKPGPAVYHGEFTTNQPLVPGATYRFRVRVKNSLQDNVWVEDSIETQAAGNLNSLLQYLLASGLPSSGSIKTILGRGRAMSLRNEMGL